MRSEIKVNEIKNTTCAYCGVGCGIKATVTDAANRIVTIQGDTEHPANFGRLCSKGSSFIKWRRIFNELLLSMAVSQLRFMFLVSCLPKIITSPTN